MATYTENLNLIKPTQSENYNVDVANTNNEIIDNAIGNKQDKVQGKGLSSNDFTTEYKRKIDELQKIYKYKGSVTNYSDLASITDKSNGDVWNVTSQNKDYAWNEIEWTLLGTNVDLSDYVTNEEMDDTITPIAEDVEQLNETVSQAQTDINAIDEEKVNKSGDTMTGNLNMGNNAIKFGNSGNIEWKENGYGDKFRIIPDFNGPGSNNKLIIQSTIGDAGTDPTNWKDLVYIHADTGSIDLIGDISSPNTPRKVKQLWGTSMNFSMVVGQHALVMLSNTDCLMIWVAGEASNPYMNVTRLYGNEAQVTFSNNTVTIIYSDSRNFTGNAVIS